jgi:D-inositol-3-phosphate glycosyltransferase
MSKTSLNDSPLSYLLVCDGRGLGGLELQMLQRVEDAHDRKQRAVLACSQKGRLWKYAEQRGVTPEKIEFNIPYYDPFAILRFGRIAREKKIDVCIVGQSRLLSQVLIARKVWRLPLSVIFYQQMQSGHPKRDWFHDRIYSSLDAAIVLTNQMKEELVKTTVMPASKIHIIPYGVRTEQFKVPGSDRHEAKKAYGIPSDAFVVGCISRFDFQKDQLLLINAFAKSELPSNSVLVLVGDVTPGYEGYDNELRAAAQTLDLADRVIFLPFTSEVPKLLSCFDVFVLPSRSETFGLVVIEAMAAGLPVIATNSGGVPEIIEHNKTGLLFPPQDEQALGVHLSRLAESAQLRAQLGSEARNEVSQRFDYTKQTDRFFEVCHSAYLSRKMA